MRKMRIEIAIVALLLAPLLGYAIGYFFVGGPVKNPVAGAAAFSDRPAAPVGDGEVDT
jgi:hypothetical protein